MNDTAGSAGAGVQMIVYTREARAYGYNPYPGEQFPGLDRPWRGMFLGCLHDGSVSLFDLRMGKGCGVCADERRG